MIRDFLSLADLSGGQILGLLDLADELKQRYRTGQVDQPLKGKTWAMIFDGPSMRTRATFEAGILQLGGVGLSLPLNLEQGESVGDVARYLECWVDGIVARAPRQEAVAELARFASVPVINAMTRRLHPCEVLADAQTLRERKGDFAGLKLAFVGAGTNVCASWFNFAARIPLNLTQICPPGYEIEAGILTFARREAQGEIQVTHDLAEGLREADVVCTDAWPRALDEREGKARNRIFLPYQVNSMTMALAKKEAILMPCPPMTRGQEVSAEVLESDYFAGFRAKENLLHAHKAILVSLSR
ncbi:MAG: ornithine carbamoyltransferase [Anaerolineae bacterium]